MMEKEFKINDILNAVNSISKIDKKKSRILEKKDSDDKNDIFKVYAGKVLSSWRKDLFAWSEKKDICGSCSAPDLAIKKDQKKRKKILSINNFEI